MATEEVNKPPSLPPYSEMIFAAIEALNDKNGSDKSSISKFMESTYGDLPAGHSTLLLHHLNRMRESGELVMVKNNYMKPNGNVPPPKRGRGRPPKPKLQLPSEVGLALARPRGRPRKNSSVPKMVSSGSGRPRGRPPKKDRPAGAPRTGRPRGRPPKVKPQLTEVGSE